MALKSIRLFVDDNVCIQTHATIAVVRDRFTPHSISVRINDTFSDYPFNVNRNVALFHAQTDWAFLVDVDLVLAPLASRSLTLSAQVIAAFESLERSETARVALVIPAIETFDSEAEVPKTFAELSERLRSRDVSAFYGHKCKPCHMPSQVDRFAALSVALEHHRAIATPYKINFEQGYEPYVVVNRQTLYDARPNFRIYDERFVGHGRSKMSFFLELAIRFSFEFFALVPGPFLVHLGGGDHQKMFSSDNRMWRGLENDELYWMVASEAAGAAEQPVAFVPSWLRRWSSFAFSSPRVCASKHRTPNADEAQILEEMIADLCTNHVNCDDLQALREFPRILVYKADWAVDRYYHQRLMSRFVGEGGDPLNETSYYQFVRNAPFDHVQEACNFRGLSTVRWCRGDCVGCQPKFSDQSALISALGWICERFGNCSNIDHHVTFPLGLTPGTRDHGKILFTAYRSITRCTVLDEKGRLCSFGGGGEETACSNLP